MMKVNFKDVFFAIPIIIFVLAVITPIAYMIWITSGWYLLFILGIVRVDRAAIYFMERDK